MGKKRLFIGLVSFFALVLFLTAPPTLTCAQQSSVIKWKGQSFLSLKAVPYGPFPLEYAGPSAQLEAYTKWLKEASGGRLIIDWAEPGAIFPVPEGDLAIGKGVIQIAYSSGAYHSGRIPEGDIIASGMFQWEDEAQIVECLHRYGFYRAMQKVYAKHNIKWIPFHTDTIVGIGTNFLAPNPASIKGKKIRAIGTWANYVHMLGGSPLATTYGEIYMAMKLGTVDGFMAGVNSLEMAKLKEVTKSYVYPPRVCSATCCLLINMDAFNALPKDLQDLLDRDTPLISYTMSALLKNQETWILKHSEKQYGLKLYAWSKEDIDRLTQQAVDEIYPKIAAKSKESAELLDIVKKQMRDYGRIK